MGNDMPCSFETRQLCPPIKIISDLLSNQSRKLAFAPRRLAVRMANPGEAKSPLICSAEKEGRDKPRMSGSVFENRKLLPVRGLPGWAGGIEPPNAGIKIQCLTTWRRPIRRGPV